ncbi:MAG: aspartate carbamoyltransferase regulatory subunit [Lachnospiraceae bacterium]|nr:aspartate carbamoyltransferase regulatory subunit [Lachnospiraceae bacterium]
MERAQYKLNVGKIEEGFVIDHISPGRAMRLYRHLGLDSINCAVAIIQNAYSAKMGKKDMIKVESPIEGFDLDTIAFLDHNATVDIIKDGEIKDKPTLTLPEKVVNVIKCKNPRCITSSEHELDHVFLLTDREKGTYRCCYCETRYKEP